MFGKLWRRRPSHATLVAYLALALALSTGTAYAANTIGSDDIIDESILSQDVHNGTLVAADLAKNTIGTGRIQDNSVTLADIAGADSTGFRLAERDRSRHMHPGDVQCGRRDGRRCAHRHH